MIDQIKFFDLTLLVAAFVYVRSSSFIQQMDSTQHTWFKVFGFENNSSIADVYNGNIILQRNRSRR